MGEQRESAFEKWCGFTITDANKAPKAVALRRAYVHAWDAALEEAAKVAEDAYPDKSAERIRALKESTNGK